MSHRKKSRLFATALLILLLAVFGTAGLPAGPAFALEEGQAEFDTKAFDVDVVVQEDNSYLITETIRVHYNEPRHGLVRYIPTKGMAYYGEHGDFVEKPFRAKITDIQVEGYPFELFTESSGSGLDMRTEYQLIQIGDENTMVDGDQTYRISYKYALPDDKDQAMDMVYLNLVPTAWISPIESAKLTVKMPKEFEISYLGFVSGEYGEQDATAVDFDYQDQTITATTNRILGEREGVTLKIDLPEGYFTGEPTDAPLYTWMLAVIVLSALVPLILWLTLGRDKKVIPTVEFGPPEGMNPAEVGYTVDGVVDDKDLVSLIIYWADQGVISIEQRSESKKENFVLHKLSELPSDARTYERTMFAGIFKDGREQVELEALKADFYPAYTAAKAQLTAHMAGVKDNQVFTRSSAWARAFGVLFTLLPLTVVAALTAYINIREDQLHYVAAGVLAFLLLIGTFLLMRLADRYYAVGRGKKIAFLLFGLLFCAGSIFGFYVTTVTDQPLYKSLAAVATVIALVCTVFLHRRTDSAAFRLAKIVGLKTFIEEAEADRIRTLVDENPSYFYHILPYAYVLGVSDRWAKNFEGIALQPPSWYIGDYGAGMSTFNAILFMHTFSHFNQQFHQHMTFVPPQQHGGISGGGGGGFGGGGFSGGGFGGGGGGSW